MCGFWLAAKLDAAEIASLADPASRADTSAQFLREQQHLQPSRYNAWFLTLVLLRQVAANQQENQMTVSNLAICCGLSFIDAKEPPQSPVAAHESASSLIGIVEYWLTNFDTLFLPPMYLHHHEESALTHATNVCNKIGMPSRWEWVMDLLASERLGCEC